MARMTDEFWRNQDPWELCGLDKVCQKTCVVDGKVCDVAEKLCRLARYEDVGSVEDFQMAANELRKRQWISVEDRLPEPEQEVLIIAVHDDGEKIITTAMYENGKIATGDSCWYWQDLDFDYDEENDEYLIPEGWWEYRHYNPDEVYNSCVNGKVTHWMPLPEPPER